MSRPLVSADRAWSRGVADAPALDWVALSEGEPFAQDEQEGFRASSHPARLPPATRARLGQAPDAHQALTLLLARPEWAVRTRGLLFDPDSAYPALLAPLVEAHGVGEWLHAHDPALLRWLAAWLPRWHRGRGSPEAARTLLAGVARLLGDATPARVQAGARALGAGPEELDDEVLGAWPAEWWEDRAGSAFVPRVEGGFVRFQPTGTGARWGLLRADVLVRLEPGSPAELHRLLPPWAVTRATAPALSPLPEPVMDDARISIFAPRNGTLLDLGSLEAVANQPGPPLWEAVKAMIRPDAVRPDIGLAGEPSEPYLGDGVVLRGLDLRGTPAPNGPPGAVDLEKSGTLAVNAGAALFWYDGQLLHVALEGAACLLPVAPELRRVGVPYDAGDPDEWMLAEQWMLALELVPDDEDDDLDVPLRLARRSLRARLALTPVDTTVATPRLPLALLVPKTTRWETDLAALWQPEDPRTRKLVQALAAIEDVVWRATPMGLAWSQGTLGTDWLRYQASASAALQAANMQLQSRALSTVERVRLLKALHDRLASTVSEASRNLRNLLGTDQSLGPYGRLLADVRESRVVRRPA